MLINVIVFTVLMTSVRAQNSFATATYEARLLDSFFNNPNNTYDKRQRPVNTSHVKPVEVLLSLSIQALQGVNERVQMITMSTWLSLEWTDYRLSWDPALYSGQTHIALPVKDIWTPRIVLENSADRKLNIPTLDEFSRVLVTNDGLILYDTAETFSSLCSINVAEFPFDKQNCTLNFTNLADTTELVVLKPFAKLIRYKYDKTQWKLVSVTGKTTIVEDHFSLSGTLSYSYVQFEVILHRLPLYHLLTSGMPSTILTLLAFAVFFMPPECGEKVSLGVSILLGLTVFQTVVSSTLPETSFGGQPLLGTYLTMNFALVASTLFCTAFSMSVYSKPGPVENVFYRNVFLQILPPILFVARPKRQVEEHDTLECEQDDDNETSEKEVDASKRCLRSPSSKPESLQQNQYIWKEERMVISTVLDRIFFVMTFLVYSLTTLTLLYRIH